MTNARSLVMRLPLLACGLLGPLTAQAQWFAVPSGTQPDAVASPGFAFDAARQQVVLFGGDSVVGVHDRTWTWNGTTWSERLPASHPGARTMVGMTYDAARQRVVLFGGFGASGGVAIDNNDTWEWDGTTWTQRFPAHAPSPRGGVAMTYDAARQRIVLFGGGLGGYMMPTFDDTWEWDGSDWIQCFPLHRPTAARNGNLAYDSQRHVSVLFGGLSTPYVKQDATWEWNGVDWTQRFPAHRPVARYAAGMAYDAPRGRMVLFGGGADVGLLADTWEFDGQDWLPQILSVKPSPRDYVALAYDAARARIVLRGGRIADTWEYGLPGTLATYETFGTGCPGGADAPSLTANGDRPILGQPFTITLQDLPPWQPTLLLFGLSNTNWLGMPLPLDLEPLGAPGCELLVSVEAVRPLFSWLGQRSISWSVPNQPALIGVQFYNQAMATSGWSGIVLTNGGHGRIGDL